MSDERFIRADEVHLCDFGWNPCSLRCDEVISERVEDAAGSSGHVSAICDILTAIIESVDSDTRNAIMGRLGWVPKK